MAQAPINTDRLKLISATPELLRMELSDRKKFATAIESVIAPGWPPGEYDAEASRYFIDQMTKHGERVSGWLIYYVVTAPELANPRELVAAVGYFGPPDANGVVEIGFSVVDTWRGRGVATEGVRALVDRALRHSKVRQIIARTTLDNASSVSVLKKSGFRETPVREKDLVRFEYAGC